MRVPLLAATSILVAACASPGDPAVTASANAGQCFFANQIDNFRTDDDGSTYIRSRQGDVFRLVSPAGCTSPAIARSIAVEPYVSNSQRICAGEQARLRIATSSQPVTCIASVEGPIMDSAVSGLPNRSRP